MSELSRNITIKITETGIRIFMGENKEFMNQIILAIKFRFSWIGRLAEPHIGSAGPVFYADLDIPEDKWRAVCNFLIDYCRKNNIEVDDKTSLGQV